MPVAKPDWNKCFVLVTQFEAIKTFHVNKVAILIISVFYFQIYKTGT